MTPRDRLDRICAHYAVSPKTSGTSYIKCPAHGGGDSNLALWVDDAFYRIGACCHSHDCSYKAIAEAIERDCGVSIGTPKGTRTEWHYGNGKTVRRTDHGDGSKKMRQSHGAVKGTPLLLLPADGPDPVVLCEGEKAAEAIKAAGLTGACWIGGAGQAHLADYSAVQRPQRRHLARRRRHRSQRRHRRPSIPGRRRRQDRPLRPPAPRTPTTPIRTPPTTHPKPSASASATPSIAPTLNRTPSPRAAAGPSLARKSAWRRIAHSSGHSVSKWGQASFPFPYPTRYTTLSRPCICSATRTATAGTCGLATSKETGRLSKGSTTAKSTSSRWTWNSASCSARSPRPDCPTPRH